MANSGLEVFGISKKKALLTSAAGLLLAGGVLVGIGIVADYHKVFHALARADKWWFFGCLAGELMAYQGYLFAYRDFARAARGPKLSWWDTTRIVGIGLGMEIFGATAAALAVDFWAVKRAGAKMHESVWRILGFNTMEWLALSAMAMASAVAVLAGAGKGAPLIMTIAWICIVPLCFISARWFTDKKRVNRYIAFPADTSPQLHKAPASWLRWARINIHKGFADAIGGVVIVRHVMGHPWSYKNGNTGVFIYWLGHLVTLYCAILAFGYVTDPAALVLAYATTYLLTILPLPFGGAGGIEATLTYVLHSVGMPLPTALASTLAFRFFTFWLPIGPALVLLPTVKVLNEQLPNNKRDNHTPKLEHVSPRYW